MSQRTARGIAALTGGQVPRVWSLLVTVFGDLGAPQDSAFRGALLGRITQPIGIKSQAMRVALHRLRKEGWITSARAGRHSTYRVTPWGHDQIAAATPRIYARAAPSEAAYLIAAAPGAPDPDGLMLRPGLALSMRPGPTPEQFSHKIDPETPLPDWMQDRLCQPDLHTLAGETETRLAAGLAALGDTAPDNPLDAAVLRVLTVHAWRRVALRAPEIPDRLLPPSYRGPAARAAAMALLDRLPRPSMADLDRAIAERIAA